MILEKSLEKFGLTDKEAKIYLAVLELGQDTIVNIANKSEQKRPTVYVIIEGLIKKGLVQKMPKGKTTVYAAENPEYLLAVMQEREAAVKKIFPLLKAIYNTEKNKPQIKFYDGVEGVRQVYALFPKAKKYIYFYGSIKDVLKNFSESFLTLEEIKKMNIPVKEIMSSNSIDLGYAKKIIKANNPLHQVKILKKGISFIIDSAIFDNKVVIVSLKDRFFGVLIESQEVADSFKVLYELAWQSAEEVKKPV